MSNAPGATGLRLFETRPAVIALSTLLAVHVFAFAAFFPTGVTVADEGTYLRQAQMILAGGPAIAQADPFTGEQVEFRPISRYPLGTALVLLPFVALGGRELACLASLLCTLAGVALTARWLFESGRSPLWAGLVLAYPPTIIFSRVAMSEAASLFVVALGLWLHGRGQLRGAAWLLAAGFVGGTSIAFREANALLFAPFFLGSLLRRDSGWPALLAGAVLGLGVRGLSSWLFFGDPLFAKPPDAFSLDAIVRTAPLYLASLLVGVPAGLVAVFAYRGPRRPELGSGVGVFVLFHLLYSYSGEPSGDVKRLLLGPRYFIPLMPLMAFAAAEAWPRLATSLRERVSSPALDRAGSAAVLASLLVVLTGVVGMQWAHGSWAREQVAARGAILEHTSPGSVVVTNWKATGKFFDLVEDDRLLLAREGLSSGGVEHLLAEHGSIFVVLLDRSDSEFWRRNAFDNELFVKALRSPKQLVFESQPSPPDRLRIYRVIARPAPSE